MNLKDKARMVFKGLDDDDYEILRFFCEEGPTSKYKASRYFEGKVEKQPKKRIARATVYRKIQSLKAKQFLKVVRHEKFESGSLKSDVEILSVETVKGGLAVFGSGIDSSRVFEEPPTEDSLIKKLASTQKQLENVNAVLDSLVELSIDLTDKKGSYPDMMHFINSALLTRRPQYIAKQMEEVGAPGDIKEAIKNFTKLTKYLQEQEVKKQNE